LDKILPNRFTIPVAEWFAGDETPSREHMADIVHVRDDLAASGPTLKKSTAKKPDAAFSATERSKYDQDFVPGKDLYMWVSVFDHTQTRHTRHVRPVRIVTQE